MGEQTNWGSHNKIGYALPLDMTKELSMEKIALQAKLLLVNNNNKDLQLELFDLIRANLPKVIW